MRASFRGYYRPTDDEFKDLWATAEISFDANVLLNLYRYSIETRDGLLQVLAGLRSQLWLSHQAAFEYQRNRIDIMSTERDAYSHIRKTIDASQNAIENTIAEHTRHLILRVEEAKPIVESAFDSLRRYVTEKEQLHPDLPQGSAPGEKDDVRDKLTELFEGRVGAPFSPEDLASVCAEGELRYEAKIPPGYEDGGKDAARAYGDLIIWKQLIAHAKESRRPIIFVTDEKKDDWWLRSRGQTILPRPELVEEIWREAQVRFYMYRSSTFMEIAQQQGGKGVSRAAVKEVQEVADQNAAMEEQLSGRRKELLGRYRASVRRLNVLNSRLADMSEKGPEVLLRDSPSYQEVKVAIRSLDRELAQLEERLAETRYDAEFSPDDEIRDAAARGQGLLQRRMAACRDEMRTLQETYSNEERRRQNAVLSDERRLLSRRSQSIEEIRMLEAEMADLERLSGST